MEHGVAEAPVGLRRDLLLGVPSRHLQLQQRVEIIRVLQDHPQAPHFLTDPEADRLKEEREGETWEGSRPFEAFSTALVWWG